jgi:phage terminase large subunit-like protein
MAADADWQSEDVWRAVNPNLGVTITRQFLQDEYRRARETPAYENTFRNLYLNQWTQQSVLWLPMDAWDAGNQPLPSLDGEPCWAGLDLSTTTDITAFVMAFPVDNGRFAIVPHFWIPEEAAHKRERVDRVPYQFWAKQGFVTMTPGNVVDYDQVRSDIRRFADQYHIIEIAADRWNATQMITQLASDGLEIIPFGQGFASMSGPSKEFEKVVIGKQLIHGGNPVLRWMASNVSIARDAAGNIKPVKDSSAGRIDGIVAAIMALGRAASHGVTQQWYNASHSLEIG